MTLILIKMPMIIITNFGSDRLACCSFSYAEVYRKLSGGLNLNWEQSTCGNSWTQFYRNVWSLFYTLLLSFSKNSWCLWTDSGLTQRLWSMSSSYQKSSQRYKYKYYCLKHTLGEKGYILSCHWLVSCYKTSKNYRF